MNCRLIVDLLCPPPAVVIVVSLGAMVHITGATMEVPPQIAQYTFTAVNLTTAKQGDHTGGEMTLAPILSDESKISPLMVSTWLTSQL